MVLTAIAMYWTAFVLWIGFKTSAVYEYLRLIPMCEGITHTKQYQQFKKADPLLTYSEFMGTRYNSFIVRMCSCSACIGVWIAFVACWTLNCFHNLPIVYGGGLILYLVFSWLIKRLTDA